MEELRTEEMIEVTTEVAQEVAEQVATAGLSKGAKVALGFGGAGLLTLAGILVVKGIKKRKAKKAAEATDAETVDESNFDDCDEE